MGYAIDALLDAGLIDREKLQALDRTELIRALAEAQIDVQERIAERDQGIMIPGQPKTRILNEPELASPEPAPRTITKGLKLSEALAAFHGERSAGNRSLASKTMEEHRVAVRMLTEFLGRDAPVRSISRADMIAFKQTLLRTPTRYSIRFPGRTLPQAIKANEKRAKPYGTLQPATINVKWLSHLSTLFKWCSNNGHLETNPAFGVRVDEGKGYREPTRVPFTGDDLKRLFGSPLFTAVERKHWATKQWALLLALFTGARSSSELARIRLADIYTEQGVHVINLALASKNVRSKRLVPLHDDLIRLGFLEHVERLAKRGKTRLFEDWEPEDKINRWFLRSYRPEVGITDSRKVMHSFRHTLKTALAHYGVSRDVSDLITGHADQTVAGIYIAEKDKTMVRRMAEGLNRVKFTLPVSEIP